MKTYAGRVLEAMGVHLDDIQPDSYDKYDKDDVYHYISKVVSKAKGQDPKTAHASAAKVHRGVKSGGDRDKLLRSELKCSSGSLKKASS
jgi:hypothetical protein